KGPAHPAVFAKLFERLRRQLRALPLDLSESCYFLSAADGCERLARDGDFLAARWQTVQVVRKLRGYRESVSSADKAFRSDSGLTAKKSLEIRPSIIGSPVRVLLVLTEFSLDEGDEAGSAVGHFMSRPVSSGTSSPWM